jgi:ADP-heptose:LPS heptosyltransferase
MTLLGQRSSLPLVVLSAPGRSSSQKALQPRLSPGVGGVLPPLALPDALRIVAGATLVVSVDGGIMHAAVALQRPTLALFGPTDPQIWFPYQGLGPYQVLCRRDDCHPCGRHTCPDFLCLPRLEAVDVAEAAMALLSTGTDV